jgi:hypothetical protein
LLPGRFGFGLVLMNRQMSPKIENLRRMVNHPVDGHLAALANDKSVRARSAHTGFEKNRGTRENASEPHEKDFNRKRHRATTCKPNQKREALCLMDGLWADIIVEARTAEKNYLIQMSHDDYLFVSDCVADAFNMQQVQYSVTPRRITPLP